MLYLLARIIATPVLLLLLRPRIRGYKRLFFKGPAIIVSNHWALTDPVFIGLISPRTVHFMAKQELFESPVARFLLMKGLYAFPVDRRGTDIASLRKAMEVLKKGEVFGIFPEGHRTATGRMDDLEKGAAFLAVRCKVPVIPVYTDPGTWKHLKLRMEVGEPIDPAEAAKNGGKAVDAVTEAITDSLHALKLKMEA